MISRIVLAKTCHTRIHTHHKNCPWEIIVDTVRSLHTVPVAVAPSTVAAAAGNTLVRVVAECHTLRHKTAEVAVASILRAGEAVGTAMYLVY